MRFELKGSSLCLCTFCQYILSQKLYGHKEPLMSLTQPLDHLFYYCLHSQEVKKKIKKDTAILKLYKYRKVHAEWYKTILFKSYIN